jgi:DNA-binding NarL/FixJ family response regulator
MSEARILIVEDESALLRGLKDAFAAKGYEVLAAQDGQAGLDLALSTNPDLILLDIMLPRVNGYEIRRAASPGVWPLCVPRSSPIRAAQSIFRRFETSDTVLSRARNSGSAAPRAALRLVCRYAELSFLLARMRGSQPVLRLVRGGA